MYKKSIFNLLLFLTPIGINEQHKKDISPRMINYKYNILGKNNLHQIDNLFEANDDKNFTIKIFWEEHLLSHKRYCSSSKKLFS